MMDPSQWFPPKDIFPSREVLRMLDDETVVKLLAFDFEWMRKQYQMTMDLVKEPSVSHKPEVKALAAYLVEWMEELERYFLVLEVDARRRGLR
jgi:hypothetical protein